MTSPKPSIWALSDGRAGNVAMALGLAERTASLTGGKVTRKDLDVSGLSSLAPPRMWGLAPSKSVLRRGGLQLMPPWPDIAIGAGRRVAPFVAALRAKGTRTVQILDPKMNPARFDLLVVPEHDALDGSNVFSILGSVHRITPALLKEARETWEPRLAEVRRPFMAVLVGGSTKRKEVTPRSIDMLANDLRALSGEVDLVITTSRRTGEENAARLRAALPDAWFWDGEGDNPYFGMLACADAILVTDDSVNMASEAAAAGKPLAIYPLLQERGKISDFQDALIERGHAERFLATVPAGTSTRLDETGRAAEAVAALLTPPRSPL